MFFGKNTAASAAEAAGKDPFDIQPEPGAEVTEVAQQYAQVVTDNDIDHERVPPVLLTSALTYGKQLANASDIEIFFEAATFRHSYQSMVWDRITNRVAFGHLESRDKVGELSDAIVIASMIRCGDWSMLGTHYDAMLIKKSLPLLTTPEAVLDLGAAISTYRGLMLLNMVTQGNTAGAFVDALAAKHQEDVAAEERRNQQVVSGM